MSRRIAFGKSTDPHADDATAFDERQVERNLGYLAGGEADDEKTPAPCHIAERRLRVGAANRIVDHIEAFALRDRLHARTHVLGRVIDRFVGTMFAAYRELLRGRRAGNHTGPEHLADLDRRETYASGGAEYE